jgi:uncharacterized protein (DUF2336 family)
MNSVSSILTELERAMATRAEPQRAATIAQIADMFVARAEAYDAEQIGLFDAVIGRLVAQVGEPSRIDLAFKLADLATAPRGVIRQLAMDEIPVARPVLTRSPRLDDQDLIAVAGARGRDHMLAITERPTLAEIVTDFLVVKGDRVVAHGLAANTGARFSRRALALLATRSLSDTALQSALGQRQDLPEDLVNHLAKAARRTSSQHLANLPAQTPDSMQPLDLEAASQDIEALVRQGALDEAALARFGADGDTARAVCALAVLAQLTPAAAQQLLTGADKDGVLVVCRALGFGWSTVKALFGLRPEPDRAPHVLSRARANYEALTPQTAQRVLQFMRVKEELAVKPGRS